MAEGHQEAPRCRGLGPGSGARAAGLTQDSVQWVSHVDCVELRG